MNPPPITVDQLLARLPPFEAATRRHAAQAVVDRLAGALTLAGVAQLALSERAALRAQLAALTQTTDPGVGTRLAEAQIERLERDLGRRETEARVAFLGAVASAEDDPAERAGLDDLAEALAADDNWQLACAGWRELTTRARAGHVSPSALGLAQLLATRSAIPVWTRIAALEFLAAAYGPASAPVLARWLADPGRAADDGPPPAGDDCFVRAAAARLLCAVDPQAGRAALTAALAHERSEYVRMELVTQLGQLGAIAVLCALLDPSREPSPRVRGVVAIALTPIDPLALAHVMLADPHEIPRRIALEQAEPIAEAAPAIAAAIERLAVGDCRATPELARLAAEAAERVHHRRDGTARTSLILAEQATCDLREGQQGSAAGSVGQADLGRALAVLATLDFGFEARVGRRGYTILRGDRVRRRLWRLWHEARSPAPEKRQGHLHTVGRVPRDPLRAPPGRLAEVTTTRVPGERVVVPSLGDWGRHLPTVDDLLGRPPGGEAFVFSAFGVTRIGFPANLAARIGAHLGLSARYAAYAALRARSLAGREPIERQAFADAVRRLGFSLRFWPHRRGAPVEVLDVFRGSGARDDFGGGSGGEGAAAAAMGVAVTSADVPWAHLARQALDPAASGAGHLAALTAIALGLFVVRQREARRRIDSARAAIPLSLGGWGTRGKSGTERLKAALFQGLGCEVLAKTTGCEAMLIHALPGRRAQEIFIYRSYDKATIWEQQQLLELAARLGVDVFLWECMALRPQYVEILEQHWMRDSICTLTNTYPDHENIQGPAGIDIPRSMVPFVPLGRHLLTAEDSMLPVLRQAAAERSTTLSTVSFRDHALLPADLLARFPYEEHPQNIALVLNLAQHLGVPREVALKEMADWVVPDLGVLKTYAPARWRGRQLVFSNGMSANERTGFVNNWQRLGFDRAAEIGEWVVTLVNNRADRVSRSEVFAQVLVDDAPAHAHVLVGTNLTGMRGYLDAAVATSTAAVSLFHPDEQDLPAAELHARALGRAQRALARLRIEQVGPVQLARELHAMTAGLGLALPPPPALLGPLLDEACARGPRRCADLATWLAAPLGEALAGHLAALGDAGGEMSAALAQQMARHVAVRRWQVGLAACGSAADRSTAERDFRALWADLFLTSVVTLTDPDLSGDQIIDALARLCPPGYRVRIMGAQNIKGTGLDFAYRWIAHERTVAQAAALVRLDPMTDREALVGARALALAEDVGILDGVVAIPAVRAVAARAAGATAAELGAVLDQLVARQTRLEAALGESRARRAQPLGAAGKAIVDVYDGIRRRRRADRIIEDLARGRVSHTRAAQEMRDLVKRQKGG
jgi:poly-gamma-glutamate synthase PgsB/CapB